MPPITLLVPRRAQWMFCLASAVAAAGCGQAPGGAPKGAVDPAAGSSSEPVALVKPAPKVIRLSVRQPGTIQAFEQTPIYAKIAGYVRAWKVDINAYVKKGDLLAELDVPELVKELKQKEEIVTQAREAAEVAAARVDTASARIKESKAGLLRAQKNREFYRLAYDRIAKLGDTVIDQQKKEESWNQLQAEIASEKEAEAKIETSQAALKEAQAVERKAKADIGAAEADRDRVAALVGYTRLTAPYAGVVTRRNINTWDFVQPPTAGKGEPLYVVERRDKMRVVVEVPEIDAGWVAKNAPMRVRVQALHGQEFSGTVARTSYSVDRMARTLVAEMDLENPNDRLRPGMYLVATITGQHPAALALPVSSVLTQGDVTQGYQHYCFLVRDNKAERALVQVGLGDGQFIEVVQKQSKSAKESGTWEPFTGQEEVIATPALVSEGQTLTGKK